MSSVKKLLGYFVLLCLSAFATSRAVQHHLRARENPLETGLEWMRAEYDLDDERFARVKMLHESHFARCREMTHRIETVDRVLLSKPRAGRVSDAKKRNAIELDKALSSDYETATLKHLREVASLMSGEHAERFLNDFSTSIQRQREEHHRALLAKAGQ